MMQNLMKTCTAVLLASAVLILFTSSSSYAGKISDYEYIMKTEYASHQGYITSIGRDGDYLTVSDRKIWLVDVRYRGSTIATVVHDGSGREIDFDKLSVGDRVYVFGGGRRDNEIAAKDIFLLDGKLSDKEFRDFPKDKALRTWKSEVMGGQ